MSNWDGYSYDDGTTLYLWAVVAVALVLLLVLAGVLLRAWHFRRIYRGQLEHARLTGAPEPVYRNPFLLGTRYTPPDQHTPGEVVEVPVLWDEEMCLERQPPSKHKSWSSSAKHDSWSTSKSERWGANGEEYAPNLDYNPAYSAQVGHGAESGGEAARSAKGKATLRESKYSGYSGSTTLYDPNAGKEMDGGWGLEHVQPASLTRIDYVPAPLYPPLMRRETMQPPFSHEMREALRVLVPRKRYEEEGEVIVDTARVRGGDVHRGEELGVGVLIAMPCEKRRLEGMEGVGEVGIGVLEVRAV